MVFCGKWGVLLQHENFPFIFWVIKFPLGSHGFFKWEIPKGRFFCREKVCFVDVESVSSVWVTPVGLVGWLVGWLGLGFGLVGEKSWDNFLRN